MALRRGTLAVAFAAVLLLGGRLSERSARGAGACSATAQLAYVAAQHAGQRGTVYVAAADGSNRRALVRGETPVLSPDGRMVAVTGIGNGAGLGLYTACGGPVKTYFGAREGVSGVVWSPDASMLAAIVAPHPKNFNAPEHLVVIDVASGKLTVVATGGINGASFAPAAPFDTSAGSIAYSDNGNIFTAVIGLASLQLTIGGQGGADPLWGPHGVLYAHPQRSGDMELEQIPAAGGRPTNLLKLADTWPVAISQDGVHLAAEGAACGVLFPVSVNLATRAVHQYPASFAPYGISPSGGSILIAGAPPGANCAGKPSVIETVPFGGGKPTVIAHGTEPSWADSSAANTVPAY